MVLVNQSTAFGGVSLCSTFRQFWSNFATFLSDNNDVKQARREERCVELVVVSVRNFAVSFNAMFADKVERVEPAALRRSSDDVMNSLSWCSNETHECKLNV